MHFGASKRQISIHTGVAYMSSKIVPFATVSDCLKHGPGSIWAHMNPVFKHIKDSNPDLTTVHMISDGPTTQYRCRTNFYLFSRRIFDHGFKDGGSWNFLEAGHGKGSPDGIGAVIKRHGDELVNTYGQDITCAADLLSGLKKRGSSVLLFQVKEEDIYAEEALIPASITGVPKTMQLHQVLVRQPGRVSTRTLSCFCSDDTLSCLCFSPITTDFNTPLEQRDGTVQDIQRVAATTGQETTSAVEASDVKGSANILTVPDSFDEAVVNKYCVVEYDGLPYPGKIVDVDDETVEVTVMHNIGTNRFFWPMREDTLWYYRQNILTLLEEEPALIGTRHRAIQKDVWEAIIRKLGI